jgi:hypothetical protein
MERRVQEPQPALDLLVAADGHDERVPRARGRHVCEAHGLLAVLARLVLVLLDQLRRRAPAQRLDPEAALRVHVTRGRLPCGGTGGVRQDHDRELEALGLVDRHDADALGALLDHRRLLRLATLGVALEAIDEGAERGRPAPLEAPRQVDDAKAVGEGLLAGGPDRDAGVGAHRVEQARHRLGEGASVAGTMEPREDAEGLRDLALGGAEGLHVDRVHGMQAPDPMSKGQQDVVAEGEERAAQRGEYAQLVVRPLDRDERVAQREHLLAVVIRAPAHEDVGHAAHLQRSHVGPRHVVTEALEATEEETHVPGLEGHGLARLLALGDRPAALTHEPVHEGTDGIGERLVDAVVHDARTVAVVDPGTGHRECDQAGSPGGLRASRLERHVGGLAAALASLHPRLEGRVDRLLERRDAAEALRQVQHVGAGSNELLLGAFVDGDVGTSEAVDRLLGVAHDEELPGDGDDLAPLADLRIRRGQEQQDLGLQRVGVLELVDEEVAEALLEPRPHLRVVAHQIARPQQQVEEVEATAATLALLVVGEHGEQLLAQQRREVRLAARHEPVEGGLGLFAPRQDLGPPQPRPVARTEAAPAPAARPREPAQLGLEAVVVASAHALALAELRDEAGDLLEVAGEPVVRTLGASGQLSDAGQLLHHGVDLRLARERIPPPGLGEVAVLHECAHRPAQLLARCLRARPARAPAQHATHPLRRVGQRPLPPGIEGRLEQTLLLVLGRHLEQGVHTGLHGPGAQQIRAEGVDRADVRLLQLLERRLEPHAPRGLDPGLRAGALDLRAEPELHLAGRWRCPRPAG